MKTKVLALALASLLPAAWSSSQAAKPGEWTGYITDTHCGKNGANRDHTAACVDKCIKSGSKPQLWNEADQKLYELDSVDKVKSLIGNKVVVKGTIDSANRIVVESATKAGK